MITLSPTQQAHIASVPHAATRVQLERYLRDGVMVGIARQTESDDSPPFAIYVVEQQDFWIDCCETREAALARAQALGLLIPKEA